MKIISRSCIGIGSLLLAITQLMAAPEIYFGEDVSPFYPGTINDVPRIVATNSFKVANQFKSRLTVASIESFETYARYSSPTNLTFGSVTAVLTGTREITRVTDPAGTFNGVYPLVGTNCLLLPADEVGFFAIDFSSPQAAFGFFGTDFAEDAGMQVTFIGTNGAQPAVVVPVTQTQRSGGCFFFGVINRTAPFVRIQFARVGPTDGLGFDEMQIASQAQVLPAQPVNLQIAMRPGLWVTGTLGAHYRLEFSTNNPATNWTPLTTIMLSGSPYFYTDASATNGSRFYRAVPIQ